MTAMLQGITLLSTAGDLRASHHLQSQMADHVDSGTTSAQNLMT